MLFRRIEQNGSRVCDRNKARAFFNSQMPHNDRGSDQQH
jgi:hypothetical protein